MIAPAKASPREQDTSAQNERFLEMLPVIKRYARMAFRHRDQEARGEKTQEVIANAFVAFRRLVDQGRSDLAYATPLAIYAVRQVRSGRHVGSSLNVHDVSSTHCRISKGIHLGRLDHYDREEGAWKEVLIEDRHAGPAEIAATKIDFGTWLGILPQMKRRVAQTLATGETTGRAAERFGVSFARISQLRSELRASWQDFQGEAREALAVA